jgi:hypothetical protein
MARLGAAALVVVAVGACSGGTSDDATVKSTAPSTADDADSPTVGSDPAPTSNPSTSTTSTTAPEEVMWSANQVDVRLGELFPRVAVQERAAGGIPCSWSAAQRIAGGLTTRYVLPDPTIPAAVAVTIFETPAHARDALQSIIEALSACTGTYQVGAGVECGDVDVAEGAAALEYSQTCSVSYGGVASPAMRYQERAVVVDNLLLSVSQLEESLDRSLPQRLHDAFARLR